MCIHFFVPEGPRGGREEAKKYVVNATARARGRELLNKPDLVRRFLENLRHIWHVVRSTRHVTKRSVDCGPKAVS